MPKREDKKIDMQEIMEIYKKVGTPGAPHKLLAKLEGSWTTSELPPFVVPLAIRGFDRSLTILAS